MLLMEACHSGGLLSSEAQGRRNLSSLSNRFKSLNDATRTNDSLSFVERMDELCGNFDYTSIKPLLGNILTESSSSWNHSYSGHSLSNRSTSNRHSLANFAGRKPVNKSKFFNNAFKTFQTKDISPDHPNLTVIFSASETENSYCALMNTNSEILVYNLEENHWFTAKDMNEDELPVGALVFSLVLA